MSTTTSTTTSTSSTNPYAYLNGTQAASAVSTAKEQSDRFLKLLTTQLQNQDPMNPMDNAQMTSQMAQISTVSGLETVNASLTSLGTQFVQMQALQGAAMVGRNVQLEGDRLAIDSSGTGSGGFELAANATAVKVEVVNSAGRTVDTISLGAQDAGRHTFSWSGGSSVKDSDNYSFKVTATSGTSSVSATALMNDKVLSVNTSGTSLALQTSHSGSVGYSDIKGLI